ncbi:hypothetical protein [Brevundimonas sp. PWP3-1b1]|uniref:hypothetical protein n=1 Tax=unclassified Brevundimonas TaxID=2622653 RepID=UPI003CF70B4C
MKIDIRQIIGDHLSTLKDGRTKRLSVSDLLIFFFVPVIMGLAAFLVKMPLDRDVYNAAITFFGIFIALLLNVQVAIFGIFQRKWPPPSDKKLLPIHQDRTRERRELLGELNANLSYLTLVCCVALVETFCFFVFKNFTPLAVCIVVSTSMHFLMTLLMTVKRTHVLFHKEYTLD